MILYLFNFPCSITITVVSATVQIIPNKLTNKFKRELLRAKIPNYFRLELSSRNCLITRKSFS